MLALDARRHDLVVGSPHSIDPEFAHQLEDLGPFHSLFSSTDRNERSRRSAHGAASALPEWESWAPVAARAAGRELMMTSAEWTPSAKASAQAASTAIAEHGSKNLD